MYTQADYVKNVKNELIAKGMSADDAELQTDKIEYRYRNNYPAGAAAVLILRNPKRASS